MIMRVDEARLAGAGGAGHQQVRHLGQVRARRSRPRRPCRRRSTIGWWSPRAAWQRSTSPSDTVSRSAFGISMPIADLPGIGRQDPHVRAGHRVGDVLAQRGDALDLDAGAELDLVAGHRRAAAEARDLRVDVELLEHVGQRLDDVGRWRRCASCAAARPRAGRAAAACSRRRRRAPAARLPRQRLRRRCLQRGDVRLDRSATAAVSRRRPRGDGRRRSARSRRPLRRPAARPSAPGATRDGRSNGLVAGAAPRRDASARPGAGSAARRRGGAAERRVRRRRRRPRPACRPSPASWSSSSAARTACRVQRIQPLRDRRAPAWR